MKWDKETPVEYWFYCAKLNTNDDLYSGWIENYGWESDGELTFFINCNDVFSGGSDCETISPEDAKFLFENNYHEKGWREVCEWIANKRGYSKDMVWFCDRKRSS